MAAEAQQFDYRLGFTGFFDNREYDNLYAYDQTMFGSRLRGELGVKTDQATRFAAGLDYLYEFGSKGELLAPDIILYCNGAKGNFTYSVGALPRYNSINMPLALLTDTLNYYRPNIEGILLDYSGKVIKQNIWIDWTGRRSEVTRESFTIGMTGSINKNLFLYRHNLVINHLAHTEPKDEAVSLRDNIGYTLVAGFDLSSVTAFDTLVITAGVAGSLDRIRGEYDFVSARGFTGEIECMYGHFGLHGLFYKGDDLCVTSGDRSFTAGFLARGDAYYLISGKTVESRIQFTYQFLPDATEMAMLFAIRINLGGDFKRRNAE